MVRDAGGGSVVVETRLGCVEGRAEADHLAFLGVPFARPPVGPRRFQRPDPADPWTGVRPALQRGPIAPQMRLREGPSYAPDGDEDCLYLDVRTPALGPKLRPVLVWLHGGAFQWGNSDVVPILGPGRFGGERLAQRGVVVVAVTYRLGALGWLALDGVDSSLAGSANNGLLDQLAALDWVQSNIERFGGDPDRVTIAGQSAGAIAAATLVCGPGLGKFQRAVLMSGAASSTKTMDQATAVASAVLDGLALDTIEELRKTTVDDLLRTQFAVTRASGSVVPGPDTFLVFGPVVDGLVVTEDALFAARRGVGRDVPVMLGTNDDELTNFAIRQAPDRNISREDLVAALSGRAPAGLVDAYISRLGDDHDLGAAWDDLRTDSAFRIPAIDLADARGRHNASTYRYLYSRHAGAGSASHGVQVGLFWGLYEDPPWSHLSRTMSEYFTTFIRDGAPSGPEGSPDWPPFGSRRRTMVFGTQNSVSDDPDAAIRQLWRSEG